MAKRISFEEFEQRVHKAYDGRISVVKESYVDMKHNVTVYCNIHKIFFTRDALDISKGIAKCPECFKEENNSPRNSWEDMLQRFRQKWRDKYSYDETTYAGFKTEILVHCNDCSATFKITPEHHLKYNNGGCPNCSKYKKVKCSICDKDVLVDRHRSVDCAFICDDCKEHFKKEKRDNRSFKKKDKLVKCPFCGKIHKTDEKCPNELCNRFYSINDLKKLISFGFDYSSIGTIRYFEEFNKAIELLIYEYYNNKLSPLQIFIKYNCKEYFRVEGTLRYFLKHKLKLDTRNLSESLKNAIETGTSKISNVHSFQFNTEYHKSWNNQTYLLRSSYESDFANILDESKTPYEVEKLRIPYFDTQQNKQRIAIPDFYLPDTNTIVEVKSTWTLDKQNMIDKRVAYLKSGYNFKLWLEHEYVDLDSIELNDHNLDKYK